MPKGGGRGNGGTRGSEAGIEKATDETADILHRFEVVYPTAALVVMQEFRVHDRSSHESGGTKLGSETESATRAGGTEGRGGSSEATWWGQERSEEVGGGEATQRFFDGHTDDVTAVAVHPGGVLVASGQVRRREMCQLKGLPSTDPREVPATSLLWGRKALNAFSAASFEGLA